MAGPGDTVEGRVERDQGEGVGFTLAATDADADPITYSVVSAPAAARYTLNAQTGAFSWERIWCDHATGDNTFVFRASDGSLTVDASLTVEVVDVDCSPLFVHLSDKTVPEGGLLRFMVKARDPETGAIVPSLVTVLPTGATYNAATGAFGWKPTCTQAGTYTVTFSVPHGEGSVQDSVDIQVTEANCAPTLRPLSGRSPHVGDRVGLSLLGTDRDSDPLTYSATSLPAGANFNTATGKFGWKPTNAQVGHHDITFRVTDTGGLFQERTVRIWVGSNGPS